MSLVFSASRPELRAERFFKRSVLRSCLPSPLHCSTKECPSRQHCRRVRRTRIQAHRVPVRSEVVTLSLVVLLAPRRDRWSWIGVALAYLAAVLFGIGGIGEMAAEPTADASRAVLTTSGIAWLVVAAVLIALATSAVVRSRGSAATPA
jgi:hypothetical protein